MNIQKVNNCTYRVSYSNTHELFDLFTHLFSWFKDVRRIDHDTVEIIATPAQISKFKSGKYEIENRYKELFENFIIFDGDEIKDVVDGNPFVPKKYLDLLKKAVQWYYFEEKKDIVNFAKSNDWLSYIFNASTWDPKNIISTYEGRNSDRNIVIPYWEHKYFNVNDNTDNDNTDNDNTFNDNTDNDNTSNESHSNIVEDAKDIVNSEIDMKKVGKLYRKICDKPYLGEVDTHIIKLIVKLIGDDLNKAIKLYE